MAKGKRATVLSVTFTPGDSPSVTVYVVADHYTQRKLFADRLGQWLLSQTLRGSVKEEEGRVEETIERFTPPPKRR